MRKKKINPCPFCKSIDVDGGKYSDGCRNAWCNNCGAVGPSFSLKDNTPDKATKKAIEAWNKASDFNSLSEESFENLKDILSWEKERYQGIISSEFESNIDKERFKNFLEQLKQIEKELKIK